MVYVNIGCAWMCAYLLATSKTPAGVWIAAAGVVVNILAVVSFTYPGLLEAALL